MALIYADMKALARFSERTGETLRELERAAQPREDIISGTCAALELALDRACNAERAAWEEAENARRQLWEAEQRTEDYNRRRQEDQEPASTPSFYYERVSWTEEMYTDAQNRRSQTERTRDEYLAYASRYRSAQERSAVVYRDLLSKSRGFFAHYLDLLLQAKKATDLQIPEE